MTGQSEWDWLPSHRNDVAMAICKRCGALVANYHFDKGAPDHFQLHLDWHKETDDVVDIEPPY